MWSVQATPTALVRFAAQDCGVCPVRSNCTQAQSHKGRVLKLMRQAEYEAIQAARIEHASPEGQQRYKRRAGVEGTISQGVRASGLRRTRYRGLSKTHLQNIAIAAALNIDRIVNWLNGVPRAKTRVSRASGFSRKLRASPPMYYTAREKIIY